MGGGGGGEGLGSLSVCSSAVGRRVLGALGAEGGLGTHWRPV